MCTSHQTMLQSIVHKGAGLLLAIFIMFLFDVTVAAGDALTDKALEGSAKDQYSLGLRYLKGKDYTNAREWFRKAAEQGNAKAQTKLGWLYENGKGVEQDYGVAFSWYEKAAKQGYGYAQRPLGKFYELGLGVDPSPEKAFYWYEKAANQGIARAQANLGILYETGVGTDRNYEKAAHLYKITAEKGYPRGQYLLGKMYEQGFGVEKNIQIAKQWYRKSADSNYSRSIKRLKELASPGAEKPPSDPEKTIPPQAKPAKQKKSGPKTKTEDPPAEELVDDAKLSEDLIAVKTMDKDQAKKAAQEHFLKGNIFFKKGQHVEAVLEYKKSLIYNSNSANTLANMGITYAELGKVDEGIRYMHKAVSANPTNSKTYAALGVMLHVLEREQEALVQYQNAIQYDPTLADIYCNIAIIHTKLNNYDQAWKNLHMAEFFGYNDKQVREALLSLSEEPEISWPVDEKGYHLRQIVVSTREKAEEIRQMLVEGADFSALVKSESLKQFNENGGYMGYLNAKEILPSTLELLKDLPPLSYSDILETENGFHIFQRLVVLSSK